MTVTHSFIYFINYQKYQRNYNYSYGCAVSNLCVEYSAVYKTVAHFGPITGLN